MKILDEIDVQNDLSGMLYYLELRVILSCYHGSSGILNDISFEPHLLSFVVSWVVRLPLKPIHNYCSDDLISAFNQALNQGTN